MNPGEPLDPRPMRIDLATSEIEGGEYQAWADPAQVIACVYAAQPRDLFSRHVEPILSSIEEASGIATPSEDARFPARLTALLAGLRKIHGHLWRENRSVMRDKSTLRLVFCSVEDHRVYFVKGLDCWIFRVRDGKANPEWIGAEQPQDEMRFTPLGDGEKLRFEVTSLDVRPNDLLVLLSAGMGGPPDRRTVSQVFARTTDLKRACDGLVGLLGMQAAGAGAVAMRFVPVGPGSGVVRPTTDLFADFEESLSQEIAPARPAPPPSVKSESTAKPIRFDPTDVELPRFLEEVPTPKAEPHHATTPRTGSVPASGDALPSHAHSEKRAEPPMPGFRFPWETHETSPPLPPARSAHDLPEDRPAEEAVKAVESVRPSDPKGEGEGESRQARFAPARERSEPSRPTAAWLVALGLVLALLITVVAVPDKIPFLHNDGTPGGVGGVLRIDPTPPARTILIDGVDMMTGSPAILEGVDAGKHVVRCDLGLFGSLEEPIDLSDGETIDIRTQASGALEIDVAVPRPGAKAWIQGQSPRLVPCRFDSIPVGWVNLFYEDDHLPLWQRETIIRAGHTQQIRVPNAIASGHALLRIEPLRFRKGAGLVEAVGDSIYLDRQFVGLCPWEQEVTPGLHGIRVGSAGGQIWTEVVDLSAGATQIVSPRFGMDSWPRIVHTEPGRVVLGDQLVLTVTIETPDQSTARNPRIHLPELGTAHQDLPLTPIDAEQGVYVGMIESRAIPINRPVPYFFTVQTGSGTTLCSELYRFTGVNDISLLENR